MKLFLSLTIILMLPACNVEKALMQNIDVETHQNMSIERFTRLSDILTSKGQYSYSYHQSIVQNSAGEIVYVAPGLSFGGFTNGKLIARKYPDGKVAYSFLAQLEYSQGPLRHYSKASDMSGNKLQLQSLSAFERGCSGQVCYKNEIVQFGLPQKIMDEAALDDLLITLKAPAHEKRAAKKNKNRRMGIMEVLDYANEAKGGTSPEYRKNDNFDLVIPKGYIRNFIILVKNQ